MPWQAPRIGAEQRARPHREGLPPFPTGRGETPGGVFGRLPAGMGNRPVPQPPDIPSPGVVLRTGERANRSTLFEPVNVLAYGSVAALAVVLARKARGAEPAGAGAAPALPPDANVAVDPRLIPPRMNEENARRFREIQAARERANDVIQAADDFLFGEAEGAAAQRVIGGRFLVKKIGGGLAKALLGSELAGSGEEDALSRQDEQVKEQRRIMAERLFAVLGLIPRGGEGGPGGFVGPQDVADP